ncbi:MAG: molybdopterin molybdenumtransferase MoeA [Flavobacterium sp.]|uniref:molybdopterin molybdotransferase MoeA n=1 Tax=Flavobacterium sp. TaxID=239 RepID=UPI00121B68AA|nr:gephyrin-like molybdotransferase Glp [Flavobacterium sp.]RZJ64261.1 MAG: molybdopterin molybdenumtransferase MoeA [Flavobacterium sp.]
MISVSEAKQIILDATNLTIIKKKTLLDAFSHVLAEDVISPNDIPNFAQSSMDGYAIKFEDRDDTLKVIGEMAAGTPTKLTIHKGEATRIFTGAPLPDGADTVVMQEKIRRDGNKLILADDNLLEGLNVRPKGAEARKGEIAIAKGTYLSSAALGFLAGIGCTDVGVFSAPSVALILTGNELQQPGKALEFGQVYEANSVSLGSALKKAGITEIEIFTAEDSPEQLQMVLKSALEKHDIILLNGGVSVGDYDYVVSSAEACGVEQYFHKIKQKPGKPLFFGTKQEKLVFGLPGNPSSSLTCFYEYVLPALEKILRKENSVRENKAILTHDYAKPAGLTHFVKAFYDNGQVTPLHAQESFRLHSFAQANCFIVLDEDCAGCEAEDVVNVHLLPI